MGLILGLLGLSLKLVLFPIKLIIGLGLSAFGPVRLLWMLSGAAAMSGCLYAMWTGNGDLLLQFGAVAVLWSITYGFVDWVQNIGVTPEEG